MIVNCTMQDLSIITSTGENVVLEPSGTLPWVDVDREVFANIEVAQGVMVPVYRERLVGVRDIPEPEEGVWFIVSAKIADYFPEREDFVSANVLKDGFGRVVGITSFRQKQLVGEDYE